MKKLVKQLTSWFVLATLLFALSPVLADDFNPNYLLSDEEMQNWRSMSRGDIQAFLDEYGGKIARLRTEDKDGKKQRTSEIIYQSAKEYKINPKYLLVKLQKEQSLITDKSPSQKQLDGATGYGITDGCGWSCATYKENKGFGKQVDSAAGIIRWYYDNYIKEGWIKRPGKTYTIDSTKVRPINYATAFLYTYTPHLEGNQNFWNLWQKWFSQVYPDGSLVKSFSGSDVYLINNGEKRRIGSMSVLMSRFDPKMVIQVSESELANYEEGASLSFPNYSILKQGSKYYLIDFDTIRPFESHDVVKKLGYHPDEIIEVEKKDLEGYEVGTTIKSTNSDLMGRLVRLKEDKGLYYIKDNQFSPIPDEQIAYINFPYLTEENTSVKELQEYSRGSLVKFRDGTLMGIKGASEIFVIEKSKKRHIASEEVFEGFGYDWGNIVWTDELTGNAHTTGQPIYLPSRLAVAQESNIQVTSHVEEDIDSVIIEENGKVYTISEQDTEYIGKTFDTDINTYLVADYNTQEVLAGKNIDVIRPMASFVKVMTGYRLMKEGLKLNRFSTYNPAEHKSTYHRFRIATGEKYRNRDLMSSLLISSLNTPARILVSSVEDNEDKFISRMNKQAREWGLTNTKFTDTYGYDLGNLTTARDYLTIYTNSEKNVEIRKFLGSKKYEYTEVIDKDNMPTHRDNHSNHLVNTKGLDFEIISSKTGYLDEAGAGLVMLIKRPFDNKKFVVITMGNPEYTNRFDEPSNIAEWAIEEL